MAIAARQPVPESRARLTLILGSNGPIDGLVTKARPQLTALRSIRAGNLVAEDVNADFLIQISPEGAEGAGTRVDAVRFLGGSEKLRSFAENLKHLDYGSMFPDASPVKLVRRGTLACSSAGGDCTFELIVPDTVRAVN